METNSRKILRMLQQDGWRVVRIATIIIYCSIRSSRLIVVPHPKKDLPAGWCARSTRMPVGVPERNMKTTSPLCTKEDSAVGVVFRSARLLQRG
jgi:predicted RNA binding protein YcfA (HicA-like mRNA interferase family)